MALDKSEGELENYKAILKQVEKENSLNEIEADIKKLKPRL
jgi:hypothetical protein